MFRKILISLLVFIFVIGGTMSIAKNNDWDKTFKKSDKVDVKKVNFKIPLKIFDLNELIFGVRLLYA